MAKTWAEITILLKAPASFPGLKVRLRFTYQAWAVEALKAQMHIHDRGYDEETQSWYLHKVHLPFVQALARQFEDASLVEGNTITDLHTGRRIVQGDLFDGT